MRRIRDRGTPCRGRGIGARDHHPLSLWASGSLETPRPRGGSKSALTSTANITELEDLARSSPRQHPRARFDTMDSLRAIGALTVLITHVLLYFPDATGLAAAKVKHLGYDSLAIFFFISGFALYRPSVVSRIEGMPVVRIRAFCVRRVFRLFPLFWVAMTLVAIYPGPRGAFTAD